MARTASPLLVLAMALARAALAGPAGEAPPAPAAAPEKAAGGEAPARTNYELFTEANQLFKAARSEADLHRAVEDYRALLSRGIRNGRILFNLGCAHLRLGETGPAILHLRRSLLYLPENPRSLEALEFARSRVTDEFPRQDEGPVLRALFFWHYRTSFEGRLWAALLAHALFWGFLASGASVRLPFHRTALAALLIVSLAAGASAAAEGFLRPGREAVIVAPETEVRATAASDGPPIFKKPVHSGCEVRIVESSGGYLRVEFPGGVRGFVIASAVEAVEG